MKKLFSIFISLSLILSAVLTPSATCLAAKQKDPEASISSVITARSAVLIENNSGRILYEKTKDEELIPASIKALE